MAIYCIGDIHGCYTAFCHLIEKINFNPQNDKIFVLGDMVSRGEDSLSVLRWLFAHSPAVQCLLGNHDIHLLAIAAGIRRAGTADNLSALLNAPDKDILFNWLRQQPLAIYAHNLLMVHAGVLPSWSRQNTLDYAGEVATVLRSNQHTELLQNIYGNSPNQWSDKLEGWERLRVITNALTRIRYCYSDGSMDFKQHCSPTKQTNPSLIPWFDVPKRKTAKQKIAFGHWSTLGWQKGRHDIYALDSGCVWGGKLTAIEINSSGELLRKIGVTNPYPLKPKVS